MGILSFLFAPAAPTGQAPTMPLRRFSPMTNFPPNDYTVIDTETSGLDACTCELLEIAAIRYRNHKAINQFHTFVRPQGAIPESVSKINHITWSKVHNAPTLSEIQEAFFSFLGDDILVGYNIGFDIKFIQTRTTIDIKNTSFDVMTFVKNVFPDLPGYKLDNLRRRLSLGGTAHTALGDCIATGALLQRCLLTPKGQELVAIESEHERICKAEYEQYQQELEEMRAKRAVLKETDPPTSELKAISKTMAGDNEDYILAIKNILISNNQDINLLSITDPTYAGYQELHIGSHPFSGIKTTGSLKYLVLNIPKNQLNVEFKCSLASQVEGHFATRIFVTSPDDLSQLTSYILGCYNDASIKYHEARKNNLTYEQRPQSM